jgi:type IV secretion system protein VirB8
MAVRAGKEATFHAASVDWEADRQSRMEKSERRAWLVAIVAVVVALIAVIGISMLAPFRQVVPYVFAMDKTTGNVEVVNAVDDRAVVGYQELLDKHWATQYVTAHESYLYRLLQVDYDDVLGLSSDDVGREYGKLFEGPNARDKKLGQKTEIDVKIVSVTLSRDSVGAKAVVRFSKSVRHTENDATDPPQYFIASMAYEYKPSMFGKEKDLIRNPMGYRVTAYRVDGELSPVITPPAQLPTQASTPSTEASPASAPTGDRAQAGAPAQEQPR